jgi:hypothetical protein
VGWHRGILLNERCGGGAHLGLATTPIPSVSPADPCAAAAPHQYSLPHRTGDVARSPAGALREQAVAARSGGEGTGVRDGACLPATACGAAAYTRGGEQSAAEILAPWQGQSAM